MNTRWMKILALVIALLLTTFTAHAAIISTEAMLSGPSGISGKAGYDLREDQPHQEFDIELEDGPAGQTVYLYQGNNASHFASMRLNALGDGELELNSRQGPLPEFASGSTLSVKSADGTVLASGTFVNDD